MLKIHNGAAGDITVEHANSNDADRSVGLRVDVNGVPASMILLAANGTVLRADPAPVVATDDNEVMTSDKARMILKKHAASYGDSRYEPAMWVIAAMQEAAKVGESSERRVFNLFGWPS